MIARKQVLNVYASLGVVFESKCVVYAEGAPAKSCKGSCSARSRWVNISDLKLSLESPY